jgi:prepilin-type N-terminal cleavage/methylation domain-containing protein
MKRRSAAFSLVEIMVVVSIVGVVAAIATPNLLDVVVDARKVAELDRIESTLRDARNEARRRRVCVNVAAATPVDGQSSALAVAVDLACDGDFDDAGDVRRDPVTVGVVTFPETGGAAGITFGPRGGLRPGSPAVVEGRAGRTTRRYRVLPAIGAVRREQ